MPSSRISHIKKMKTLIKNSQHPIAFAKQLLLFKYSAETHSKCTICISTKMPPNSNGPKLLKKFIFVLMILKKYIILKKMCVVFVGFGRTR